MITPHKVQHNHACLWTGVSCPVSSTLPLLSSLDLAEEPSFGVLQITTLGWRVGEFHTEGLNHGPTAIREHIELRNFIDFRA